jgi:hypothetical protein
MAHRIQVDQKGSGDDEQRKQYWAEAEITVCLFEGEGVTRKREGVVFLQLHYFYFRPKLFSISQGEVLFEITIIKFWSRINR